jgi:hypothetical protein
MSKLEPNVFFDLNKLPPDKGLLLFGLSMNRLLNRQSPQKCFEDMQHISPSKVSKPLIGLNFIYSDFLYLYSDKPAPELKKTFMAEIIKHRNGLQNILEKHSFEFQIQHSFNYMVWNQLYVGTNNFNDLFEELKRIYNKDELFQKYVAEDCKIFDREMGENQINFFLEEHLMIYLLSKNQVNLANDFIQNNQKWVLFCYPGKPLKHLIYLYKLNPFKLEWKENPYENSYYDLENKKLIDFNRVDLETY